MTTLNKIPDRIEKQITLHAPIARVWRAISSSHEFGAWFGVAFDAPFAGGAYVTGRIQPTIVDAGVAALQAPHAGTPFNITIETMDAPRLFSFRWHPHAVTPGADDASEPTTLVEFSLTEVPSGTSLTITESGFDRIPLDRRAAAFTANEGGWEHQTRLIQKYLATHAA